MVQLRFASLLRGVADFCCAQRRPSPPPEQHLAKVLTAKARREPSRKACLGKQGWFRGRGLESYGFFGESAHVKSRRQLVQNLVGHVLCFFQDYGGQFAFGLLA